MVTRDRRSFWNEIKIFCLFPIVMFVFPPAFPQGASRAVRIGSIAVQGSTALVPVELVAQGNENALGFSLVYNNTLLSNPQVVLGSGATGATLNVNSGLTGQGRIGIALALATGQVFLAGTRQIVVITFAVAQSATGSTTIAFGDLPIAREVSDPSANALAATYTSGSVSFMTQFSHQTFFAHVAVGSGYSTAFTLINTSNETITGNLILTSHSGNPLLVNIAGSTASTGYLFPISLAPGGARTFNAGAVGAADPLQSGWARVESSAAIRGVATFQWITGGSLKTIVGVIPGQPMEFCTIPVENDVSKYRSVGFAVANPSSENIYIRLVTVSEDGSILDIVNPAELNPLGPQCQVARFLTDPGYLPSRAQFKGSMALIAQGGKKIVPVALVLCGSLYTAIPVIEGKAPHIPD